MGGLALKHLGVTRVDAERYKVLSSKMMANFRALFGQQPALILAYKDKTDFGDCDLLIVKDSLPGDWRDKLSSYATSKGFVRNGDITSMEMEGLQFDFISTTDALQPNAWTYFSYNDLGNLMGRVAHKMGFKYGHTGLVYVLRDSDHVVAEIPLDATHYEMFGFLGYTFSRWVEGFSTLEDIFRYTASSNFFHRDIYLLHNRNAVSRIRDAKRPTYTKFLKWCETEENLPEYVWHTDTEFKLVQKKEHLERAIRIWPTLGVEVKKALDRAADISEQKSLFNGNLVKEWTGFSGKHLGEFMSKCQNDWKLLPDTRPATKLETRDYAIKQALKFRIS